MLRHEDSINALVSDVALASLAKCDDHTVVPNLANASKEWKDDNSISPSLRAHLSLSFFQLLKSNSRKKDTLIVNGLKDLNVYSPYLTPLIALIQPLHNPIWPLHNPYTLRKSAGAVLGRLRALGQGLPQMCFSASRQSGRGRGLRALGFRF